MYKYINKVYVRDNTNVYINCIYFKESYIVSIFFNKFTLTEQNIPNYSKEKITCRIKHPNEFMLGFDSPCRNAYMFTPANFARSSPALGVALARYNLCADCIDAPACSHTTMQIVTNKMQLQCIFVVLFKYVKSGLIDTSRWIWDTMKPADKLFYLFNSDTSSNTTKYNRVSSNSVQL